jgi:hypothetical protein
MRTRRQQIACLLAAAVLGLPATAAAQSAGDEQYQDPFGGDQGQSQQPSAPAPSAGAGETAQAAPSATPTPAATAVTASAPAAQLPRTGGDPITPAVAGFWLLLGGVALRARVRTRFTIPCRDCETGS